MTELEQKHPARDGTAPRLPDDQVETLLLYTHTAQGLSENDFIMAAKFNRLIPTSS